jgi:CRISPR-associated protein Csx10
MKQNHLSDLDLTDSEVRRLFFNDATYYLNAYPLKKGKRTLPIPSCLFKDKNSEINDSQRTGVYNFAQIEPDDRDEDITPKSLGYDFCTIDDEQIIPYSVQKRMNIHHQRNRQKGRSHKGQGEIFRYEGIDSEQTFQTVILSQNNNDLALLQDLLNRENIWFGGSQSAGYGRGKILDIKPDDDWTEIERQESDRIDYQYLTITLLSDTILRNEWGQYIADSQLVKTEIEAQLAQELEFKEHGIYSNHTLIGGFNRKWGLPLPQIQAIASGSVFVFQKDDITEEEVKQLEEQGIGERRNEGFGRIAINWLEELEEFTAIVFKPEVNELKLNLSESESIDIAQTMLINMVRKKLEQKLQDKVGRFEIKNHDDISNSQLSRLMIVARDSLNNISFEPLNKFLSLDHLTQNALNQFKGTQTNANKSLYDQLQEWLKVEEWLKDSPSWIDNPQDLEISITDNIKQRLTRELATEYTLKLIIAICKKAMKEEDND